MSDGPRLVADRYRLDERIGSGAMGVVWRAHDERLDRTVAVKQLLLQPGLSAAEAADSRARAMREGRIAARLQHPHAISVFDVALGPDGEGGEGTEPWLVMEYLPSRSLATVLAEQGPLPPREVARIGRQVADALAAAHGAGIVHRDIKPGNVLLGEDGTVKITDFGISRASWDVTVTRTGVLAGTPAYFAPEVARGEVPGPASDVFSLGATLYTAVEGAPPFGLDENTLALLRAVADGKVHPPQRAGPLHAVLMRLLRDDPAERPVMAGARDMLAGIASGGSAGSTTAAVLPTAAPRTVAVPSPLDTHRGAAPPQTSRPSPPAERPAPSTAGAPWWQGRGA
ncbi:MAG: protein kinase, partial [Actinomycetota bacterium]|nr:protein kinase [Actinomycetota bacterium]